MEGDAAVDDEVVFRLAHVVVHGGVHEAERDGLVADEGLIVTLGVGDVAFVRAAVGERVEEFAHVPVFVAAFLEKFDPEIGDAHREAEVEAQAAIGDRAGHAGHAGDILGDRDDIGANFVRDFVCELEVGDGVFVDVGAEVVVIRGKGFSQAVIEIEHARHAVEAEAVDVELFEPETDIAEQEAEDFVLAVIKEHGIPRGVLAPGSGVEVLVVGAVEVVQAFDGVLDGVAVDEIEIDGEPEAVGIIDEAFEIIGRTEAG